MKLRTAAALLALPLLAACAPEIESTIYLKDVLAAAHDSKPVSVPAVLRIPQSSEDSCKEGLNKLVDNLKALAPVTGEGECIEKNGDQLAEIATSMVIVPAGTAAPEPNLFVLEVASDAPSTTIDLDFRLTRPLADVVKALAADSDELSVDFDPAVFTFWINNDLDEGTDIALTGHHVLLDGEPAFDDSKPVTLARRNQVSIVFSDVASKYVEQANAYTFASFSGAPTKQ